MSVRSGSIELCLFLFSIAVYDLGGGTFDISILEIQKGVFEVIILYLLMVNFQNSLCIYIR